MARLRDFSEIHEAASLLSGLLSDQGSDRPGGFRSGRLQKVLQRGCERAHVTGMLVLDERGLAISTFGLTLEVETVSGLCLTLANTFARGDGDLGDSKIQRIVLDLGATSRLSVQRFSARDEVFWLVAQYAPSRDPQREVSEIIVELVDVLGSA